MNQASYTDDQLIAMVRSGDETLRKEALRRIWLSGIESARGRILKKGGKTYEADDAMTEAIIVLDNHLRNAKYRRTASLKGYFAGISYWQWLAMKRPVRRIQWTDEPAAFDGEDFQTPDVLMLAGEQKELVRALLSKEELGEKCREVMRLYGLSWSMKEIAENFSTTEGFSQQLVHRCRIKLRNILEKNPTLMKQLIDTLKP